MNLSAAFAATKSGRNLCGDPAFDGNYDSYTSAPTPNPSMLATEIKLSDGRSLQDAINSKEILYTNNYEVKCNANTDVGDLYNYDSCGGQRSLNKSCAQINNKLCQNNDVYVVSGCSGNICTSSSTRFYQDCGSFSQSWGQWHCGVSSGFGFPPKFYTIMREYTQYNGCYSNACFTSRVTDIQKDCDSSVYSCTETPLGGDDCYGKNPTSSCGLRVGWEDTCNGDESNKYVCAPLGSEASKTCTDVYRGTTSCQVGYTYQPYYYARSVKCFV